MALPWLVVTEVQDFSLCLIEPQFAEDKSTQRGIYEILYFVLWSVLGEHFRPHLIQTFVYLTPIGLVHSQAFFFFFFNAPVFDIVSV